MVIKKALPRAPVVLSCEDQHRVVQVVALFADVARRVGEQCGKGQRLTDSKRKSSEEKDTRLKQKQENKARKFCRPCFLSKILKIRISIDDNILLRQLLII